MKIENSALVITAFLLAALPLAAQGTGSKLGVLDLLTDDHNTAISATSDRIYITQTELGAGYLRGRISIEDWKVTGTSTTGYLNYLDYSASGLKVILNVKYTDKDSGPQSGPGTDDCGNADKTPTYYAFPLYDQVATGSTLDQLEDYAAQLKAILTAIAAAGRPLPAVIAVENEELNPSYYDYNNTLGRVRGATVLDYLKEVQRTVTVVQAFNAANGTKIAVTDGGITRRDIALYTWNALTPLSASAQSYLLYSVDSSFFLPGAITYSSKRDVAHLTTDASPRLTYVDQLINGVTGASGLNSNGQDFVNVHWYGPNQLFAYPEVASDSVDLLNELADFGIAINTLKANTGKTVISTEMGPYDGYINGTANGTHPAVTGHTTPTVPTTPPESYITAILKEAITTLGLPIVIWNESSNWNTNNAQDTSSGDKCGTNPHYPVALVCTASGGPITYPLNPNGVDFANFISGGSAVTSCPAP